MTSLPSFPRIAMSRASARSCGNMSRSRESVVRVTVSHGMPDMSCCERVSRSLLICRLPVRLWLYARCLHALVSTRAGIGASASLARRQA